MSSNNICSACGADLKKIACSYCPYCGSALKTTTIIDIPAIDTSSQPVSKDEKAGTAASVVKPILEPSNSAFYNPNAKPAVSASFTSEKDGAQRTISGRWAINLGAGGAILLCLGCCGLPLLLTILGVFGRTK